jgi:transposase
MHRVISARWSALPNVVTVIYANKLVHGARSVVSCAAKKTDPLSLWATKLRVTKPFNKVAVAMARRLARLIWILLTRQEHYSATPTGVSA